MSCSQPIVLLCNLHFYCPLTVLQLYYRVIENFNYVVICCNTPSVIRDCSHANLELFGDSQYNSLGISIILSFNYSFNLVVIC